MKNLTSETLLSHLCLTLSEQGKLILRQCLICRSDVISCLSSCVQGIWKCSENKCQSSCHIYGDGQVHTFDKKWYSYDGLCQYVLAEVSSGDPLKPSVGKHIFNTKSFASAGRENVHFLLQEGKIKRNYVKLGKVPKGCSFLSVTAGCQRRGSQLIGPCYSSIPLILWPGQCQPH